MLRCASACVSATIPGFLCRRGNRSWSDQSHPTTRYLVSSRVESNNSFQVLEESVLEGAKAKLRYSIEIVKRLHTAKINGGKFTVFMQRLGQLTPLHSESIHGRL